MITISYHLLRKDVEMRMTYSNSVTMVLITILSLTIGGFVPALVQAAEDTANEMKEARRKAAHRQRRIIYNNDGGDIDTGWSSVTPESYLALRMEHLVGTQVDSIFWCPGCTTVYSYPTKVAETVDTVISDHYGPNSKPGIARDNARSFMEAGIDPLAMTVDFCHRNGIECFISHRMNDVHDAHVSHWFLSKWKRDHPECLLGREGDNTRYGPDSPRYVWSALDYEVPEVRDYLFRIMEEICQGYDLDGLELDWLKVPMFFRPTLDLEPVEPKHVKIMNDFVRRLRTMTEEVGRKRGRPLLLGCRVPRTVRHGLAVGLDVTTWLEEDLVDILTLSAGYQPMAMASEVREMADLAHQHDVMLYPCISSSGIRGPLTEGEVSVEEHQRRPGAKPAWRGAAANIWNAGGDGVYVFNLFPEEPDDRFNRLGSTETLKGQNKLYAVDHLGGFVGWHLMALCQEGRLPMELSKDETTLAQLPVGEDVVANAPAGKSAKTTLRLRIRNLVSGDEVTVKLNGKSLGAAAPVEPLATEPATHWLELEPDPALVKSGDNLIAVQLTTERELPAPLVMDSLILSLRYE
jgi:hypothetical protein